MADDPLNGLGMYDSALILNNKISKYQAAAKVYLKEAEAYDEICRYILGDNVIATITLHGRAKGNTRVSAKEFDIPAYMLEEVLQLYQKRLRENLAATHDRLQKMKEDM